MLDFNPFIGTLTCTFLREWVKIYIFLNTCAAGSAEKVREGMTTARYVTHQSYVNFDECETARAVLEDEYFSRSALVFRNLAANCR